MFIHFSYHLLRFELTEQLERRTHCLKQLTEEFSQDPLGEWIREWMLSEKSTNILWIFVLNRKIHKTC